MYLLALLGLLLAALPASAQELQREVKRWNVYTLEQDGETRCYMASRPERQSGSFKKRGQPFLMVTDRGVKADEISFSPGYAIRGKNDASFLIDGKVLSLVVEGETGWTRDLDEDRKAIEWMRAKNEAVIRATSLRSTTSEDIYSLSGFGQAYDEMKRLCQSN